MNDIIAMHRADLVNAVTEAVQPLKARIDQLEAQDEVHWKTRRSLLDELARCRAANVYDAEAHRKAAERDAAHIQCGHNQLTISALGERCSALEAALIEIRDKGLHHVQSWHVEKAASALETKGEQDGK